MKRPSPFLAASAAFAVLVLTGASVSAQELTAAEKLYADLAKLPAAERTQKLIDGAKKEGELSITRGYGGQEGIAHLKLFENRYGVKVKYEIMGSQFSAERVITEERVGKHLTDVSSISSPDLGPIIKYNIPAKNPTPEAARILPQYKGFVDPTGQNRWVAWYATTHGIGYNPSIMKDEEAPKTWDDLCKPQYKGLMSWETLEVRMLLGLYYIFDKDVERVGKYLECIAKNDPIVMKGHIPRIALLMAGDHPLSPDLLIYKGVFDNMKNPKKAPFKAVYTAPVFMDSSGLVINRNAPHPHAAALFVDWSMGEESQKYMFDQFRETLAMQHPFLPPEAQIVTTMYVEESIVDKLTNYWLQYIGKR